MSISHYRLLLLTLFITLIAALPLQGRATVPAVQKLVSRINDNITVLKQEQARHYPKIKIDIVNQGIAVRTNSQKIAPIGNAAVAGLETVATVQKGELKLVRGLSGNPGEDNPNLSKLQMMFSGGIKQTQQNSKHYNAASGCTAARLK